MFEQTASEVGHDKELAEKNGIIENQRHNLKWREKEISQLTLSNSDKEAVIKEQLEIILKHKDQAKRFQDHIKISLGSLERDEDYERYDEESERLVSEEI